MILNKEDYKKQLPSLVNLFKRCFNREINEDFFVWRYLNNPLNDLLVAVEFDEKRIIANYSATPSITSIKGKEEKTALSMTTMTDPQYRGKGLFVKLASELYEYMYKNNYKMIYGFPNKLSHKTLIQQLQWNDLYEIPTFIIDLKTYEKKINDPKLNQDPLFNYNYERVLNISKIHVSKNTEYLVWRYSNNPVNKYKNYVLLNSYNEVTSFCVVKKYNNSLDIVDYQAKDKHEALILLEQVIYYAKTNGFESINYWAPRHHFIHNVGERVGFFNTAPVTYLGFKDLSGMGISDNYNDWYIQMGDSDVY